MIQPTDKVHIRLQQTYTSATFVAKALINIISYHNHVGEDVLNNSQVIVVVPGGIGNII